MKSLLQRVAEFPLENVQLSISPVAKGETVVGVLPDELKQLWGLMMEIKKEGAPKFDAHCAEAERLETELKTKLLAGKDLDPKLWPAEVDAIIAEKQKAKKVNDEFVKILQIFWSLVKLEFDIEDSMVGIREGGQVVTWKNEEPEEGMDFAQLGALLDMITGSDGGIPVFRIYTGPQKKGGIGDLLETIFGGR